MLAQSQVALDDLQTEHLDAPNATTSRRGYEHGAGCVARTHRRAGREAWGSWRPPTARSAGRGSRAGRAGDERVVADARRLAGR